MMTIPLYTSTTGEHGKSAKKQRCDSSDEINTTQLDIEESDSTSKYEIGSNNVKACFGCKIENGDINVNVGTLGSVIEIVTCRRNNPLIKVRWDSMVTSSEPAIGLYRAYGLYDRYSIQKIQL